MLGLPPKPVRTHLPQVRSIQVIQIIGTATSLELPSAGCLALTLPAMSEEAGTAVFHLVWGTESRPGLSGEWKLRPRSVPATMSALPALLTVTLIVSSLSLSLELGKG